MNNKKRIVLVCNTSWGIANFRLAVINALQQKDYEVFAVAPADQSSPILLANNVSHLGVMMDNKGTSPWRDLVLVCSLIKKYKSLQPDFIFHYTIKPNIYGSIAAGILGIPSIAFITGAGYVFSRKTILTNIVKQLFKFSLRYSKEVWFLNSDDASLFLDNKLVKKEKVRILPGEGIDTHLFAPKDYPEETGFVTFLFFSRLLWEKGIGYFVQAADRLKTKYPNCKFQILGFLDCENPEAVKKEDVEMWERKGSIEYLGATNDVREYIESADCVVLPSYYREGIPRTLLEAASLEKPIITTNNVGCREVVEDNVTGFLCRVRDEEHLAEKMELIINMTGEERMKMGKRARQKVLREFDQRYITEKYLETLGDYLH